MQQRLSTVEELLCPACMLPRPSSSKCIILQRVPIRPSLVACLAGMALVSSAAYRIYLRISLYILMHQDPGVAGHVLEDSGFNGSGPLNGLPSQSWPRNLYPSFSAVQCGVHRLQDTQYSFDVTIAVW